MCDAKSGNSDKVVKVVTHFKDGSTEEWSGEAARVFHKDAWWYLGECGSMADFEPTIVRSQDGTLPEKA